MPVESRRGVIAVQLPEYLLVIHVMLYDFRKKV